MRVNDKNTNASGTCSIYSSAHRLSSLAGQTINFISFFDSVSWRGHRGPVVVSEHRGRVSQVWKSRRNRLVELVTTNSLNTSPKNSPSSTFQQRAIKIVHEDVHERSLMCVFENCNCPENCKRTTTDIKREKHPKNCASSRRRVSGCLLNNERNPRSKRMHHNCLLAKSSPPQQNDTHITTCFQQMRTESKLQPVRPMRPDNPFASSRTKELSIVNAGKISPDVATFQRFGTQNVPPPL